MGEIPCLGTLIVLLVIIPCLEVIFFLCKIDYQIFFLFTMAAVQHAYIDNIKYWTTVRKINGNIGIDQCHAKPRAVFFLCIDLRDLTFGLWCSLWLLALSSQSKFIFCVRGIQTGVRPTSELATRWQIKQFSY